MVTFKQLEDLILAARAEEFDDLVKEASFETIVEIGERCSQACSLSGMRYVATHDEACQTSAQYFHARLVAVIRAITSCDEVPLETRFLVADVLNAMDL